MRPKAASCFSRGQTPPSQRMTASVLVWRTNSSKSAASQSRKRNRSVSTIVSAMERCDSLDDRVDGFVHMLDVGTEAEDGATDVEGAIDARAAHHHAAFLLKVLEQPLGKAIDVAVLRNIAEGDDREVGWRSGDEPIDLRQAPVEVASQRELLRLGRAERGDARDLQRQPQPHGAKVPRQFGGQVGG